MIAGGYSFYAVFVGTANGQRQFHRGLANGIGLLDIGFRGNVARRPLQIVGHRPMALVTELRSDQVGYDRRYPAQLCMAEGVLHA